MKKSKRVEAISPISYDKKDRNKIIYENNRINSAHRLGLAQGEENTKKKMIKELYENGVSIEVICKSTGKTRECVENIIASL